MIHEYKKDEYLVSNDKRRLQAQAVYDFLTNSYWDKGITYEDVKKKIKYSYCFGLYYKKAQIGFCRVITDKTTFSYLADVFIVEGQRGRGLSKWMMECVINHPDLINSKTWMLKTADAHGLYEQFGFKIAENPREIMEMKKKQTV